MERADPIATAEAAGLHYVNDDAPGIRRRRQGRGFSYIGPQGQRITDLEEKARIAALGIPPAWTEVWISPDPQGHILATGRDAKGRKQYRYHPEWRQTRDSQKFERMIAFAEALPTLRERVEADLKREGLSREKVLATVVQLLQETAIRIGNQEYANTNDSYGLTTLHDKHVRVRGSRLRFQFRGKSGKDHEIRVENARLAELVKQCRDVPGYQLFQYYDADGKRQRVTSNDVNAYLHEITGQTFTAKDFRTWMGTLVACQALRECGECQSATQAKRHVMQAVRAVAAQLGNTPTISRNFYIHPLVLDAYLDEAQRPTLLADLPEPTPGLKPDEQFVLDFLRALQQA